MMLFYKISGNKKTTLPSSGKTAGTKSGICRMENLVVYLPGK